MNTVTNDELDFARDAKSALQGDRIPGANLLLFGIIALLASLVFWASRAEIDEVTKGNGKVIPSSSIQTIQNLEGGILREINVTEGQIVSEGDMLVRIDDTMSNASFRENVSQVDTLDAQMHRLYAEATGQEPVFSDRLISEKGDLVNREMNLFNKRKADLQLQEQVLIETLGLAEEELSMTIPLVQKRVVAKVEQIRLQRDVTDLKGKFNDLGSQFQKGSMEEYNEVRGKLEALRESVRAHQDRVSRAIVRSPVNGTVNKVYIKTVGGVIQPGESIIDIVPLDDTLLVEANIRPKDIAFLHPGQEATVKFTAYDFSIYGGLKGEVEFISADTIRDEIDQKLYYQIRVRNNTGGGILKDGKELPIIPGMVAEVDILTGRRTVLQYLSKPFHRARFNSLNER